MGSTMCGGYVKDSQTRQIDLSNKQLLSSLRGQLKILLLGTGESGKSTIFKQMKIIQDRGCFTDEEKIKYQLQIYANCVSQMRCIIETLMKRDQPFQHKESLDYAKQIMEITSGTKWSKELGDMIKALWSDSMVKGVCQKGSILLNDTAMYFFDNIDRINEEDYIPSEDDLLRVRLRSTGIEEAEFTFDKIKFKVVDVGGQRSERRKWIHCFDQVTAVIFCASLVDYDLPLREDPQQNRLREARLLFTEVCTLDSFKSKSIVLFLNKTDLLREKLPTHPLELWQTDYLAPHSNDPEVHFSKASEFIKDLFIGQIDKTVRPPHSVYHHFTCALNKENMKVVMKAVRMTILHDRCERSGFMVEEIM